MSSSSGVLHKEIFQIVPFIGGLLFNKKQLFAFCHSCHIPKEDWKESALDCASEWLQQRFPDVCIIPIVGKDSDQGKWVSRYLIVLAVSVQFPGTSREAAMAAVTPIPGTFMSHLDFWFPPELRDNNPRIFDKDIPWCVYDWTKFNRSFRMQPLLCSLIFYDQQFFSPRGNRPSGQ